MSASLLRDFCWRILRAYRQHFPIQGGGAWVEGDTIVFSFNHPQCTLFLHITASNPELGKRLTVNLSTDDSAPFVSVDSTGICWNSPKPNLFTPEQLQSLENLASRFYLVALDLADELKVLTSTIS
jgi:hypothetical protein